MRFLPDVLRADLIRYFVVAFALGVGITALFGTLILGNDDLGNSAVSDAQARGVREGERSGFREAEQEGGALGLIEGRAEGERLLQVGRSEEGYELAFDRAWNDALLFAIERSLRRGLGLIDAIPEWRALLRSTSSPDVTRDDQRRLAGWGATATEQRWLRRSYDPIGWPSLAGLLVGILLTAVVGAVFDPINIQTRSDVSRAVERGVEQGEEEVRQAGFDAGYADGLAIGIGESVEPAPPGAFADAYREGLSDGWNAAIDAGRQAIFDKGLG